MLGKKMAAPKSEIRVKDPFEINLDCIHCGLCLPKCPTYQVLGLEPDSPRGRIYLMQAARQSRICLDETVVGHLDCCLGCRACESACPSGVRYEVLLNETRSVIRHQSGFSLMERLALRQLISSRRRLAFLALLLRAYQKSGFQRLLRRSNLLYRIAPGLADAEARLPQIPAPGRLDTMYPAFGTGGYRVGFLSGCVMPLLMPEVHAASVEVLRLSGCHVFVPRAQVCCGALHVHAGDRDTARRLARKNLKAFPWQRLDAIVVNSAGCGATMKEYAHLFEEEEEIHQASEFQAKVRDISEFLAEIGTPPGLRPLPMRVAYDDPCHLLHGQRISAQPRLLLQRVPGLELLAVPNSDRCCGSAGIYNLVRPDMADELLQRKLDEILSVRPDRIATGNPGCILQIRHGLSRRGLSIPVQHPVEILQESMGG
jgi:glycolate oxidase iron-sulfur subunit